MSGETRLLNENQDLEGDDNDDDDDYNYGDEDYEDDGIASDIGENEPGMVPSRGPNCQVGHLKIFIYCDLISLKSLFLVHSQSKTVWW